ncbi:MAG: hypothetical protein HOO06_15220 [Bdellovibrionaceae bacterium]|jgi:hypothetical protein|nr:hypothetical protein [Pseudobdellovibrionaceae bacterium]
MDKKIFKGRSVQSSYLNLRSLFRGCAAKTTLVLILLTSFNLNAMSCSQLFSSKRVSNSWDQTLVGNLSKPLHENRMLSSKLSSAQRFKEQEIFFKMALNALVVSKDQLKFKRLIGNIIDKEFNDRTITLFSQAEKYIKKIRVLNFSKNSDFTLRKSSYSSLYLILEILKLRQDNENTFPIIAVAQGKIMQKLSDSLILIPSKDSFLFKELSGDYILIEKEEVIAQTIFHNLKTLALLKQFQLTKDVLRKAKYDGFAQVSLDLARNYLRLHEFEKLEELLDSFPHDFDGNTKMTFYAQLFRLKKFSPDITLLIKEGDFVGAEKLINDVSTATVKFYKKFLKSIHVNSLSNFKEPLYELFDYRIQLLKLRKNIYLASPENSIAKSQRRDKVWRNINKQIEKLNKLMKGILKGNLDKLQRNDFK